MSKVCSLCGSKIDMGPLAMQYGATCPLCGNALPTVGREESFNESLEWIEQENPVLFDRLIEKRNRRAARHRTVRRVGIVVAVVLLGLVVYLMVS